MRTGEALRVNASQVTRFSSADTAGVYVAVGEATESAQGVSYHNHLQPSGGPVGTKASVLQLLEIPGTCDTLQSLDLELLYEAPYSWRCPRNRTRTARSWDRRVQWKEMDKQF